jgi:hypothetical protein
MLKRIILMAVILTTIASANAAQVGQWTTFLPYWEISDIEPGQNKIFVLASKSLFSYNTADNSVEEYNKANSLNGGGECHHNRQHHSSIILPHIYIIFSILVIS